MDRKMAEMKKGVSSGDVAKWAREIEEAKEYLRECDPNLAGLEDQQIEKRLSRYDVKPLGSLETQKPEGYRRFMSTQLNGTATKAIRDVKIEQTTNLINRYDVDMLSYQEHGLNMGFFPSSQTFDSFFEAEVKLRSITGHNTHENPDTPHQQGGTGLLAVNEISEYIKKAGCTDWRGLGRWSSYVLSSSPDHRTRVISAYCVGKHKTEGPGRVYQQHLRHIMSNDDIPLDMSPYDLFCEDLVKQLQVWNDQGDQLILMMDANDHVIRGHLARWLTDHETGLDLVEISHKAWGDTEPNTHVDGSQPIDGVWASRSLEIGGFKILSFGESVGDHRTMIFDVSTRSLIGVFEHSITRAECRRLNTKTSSLPRYTEILERMMDIHRMEQRLDAVVDAIVNDCPTPAQKAKMESLDRQMVELQKCAERRCRKIIKPDMEFSPQVKLWQERMWAYKALIRWKKGNPCNQTNIIRMAIRREICDDPRQMTLEQMQAGEAYARNRKRLLRDLAPGLRKVHLRNCLMRAEHAKDETKAKGIKAKMEREGQKKMWYFINRSQKDLRSGAFHVVERVVDGVVQESTDQEETEQFIFDEAEMRFQLAAEAPIESTKLIEQLGYLGDSEIAKQLIEGRYEIPDELDDATALLLQEIGRVGVQLTNGDITITITPEEFQHFWKRVREGTASSYSGIHYGHYKAAAHSDKISNFLAKKITLISRTGVPPERWSYGLTVMLEKIAGISLVNKLRAILLMEADFNMHNKLLFGKRMLDNARANGIIPPEQYSEQQSTAEDGSWDKILQSDLSRQMRTPLAIISADAGNCYDRIHHAIIALVFRALCMSVGTIAAMLLSIQLMKFYLRTGWGESQRFIGGDIWRILHGLCQGNGAAPAGWLALSSLLVWIQKRQGYGAKVQSPITRVWLDIMGVLYVDDTDLLIMDVCLKSPYDLWQQSQDATTSWGKLLLATGGVLKPPKCFYYFLNYEWQDDGSWEMCEMADLPPLTVPLPDGTDQEIKQLPIDESAKTLGVWTNPAGDCLKQLEVIQEKLETWTNRLTAGKLPAKWAWVSYFQQLWAGLRYGLGTNSSPVEDLEGAEDEGGILRKTYRKMLPFLGVNRNIKSQWRHLHSSFGGIGLRKLLVEVVIARVNLFLQHYKTQSSLGTKLTISLECLQLEAGFNCCPLSMPFEPMGPLTTHCWCRSFWQSLDHFGFQVQIDYPEMPLPRHRDELIIALFQRAGVTTEVLRSLNRCRIVWGMLFLSDITAANGRQLERKFLGPPTTWARPETELEFSEERPTTDDWAEWAEFWKQFTLQGLYLETPLGDWVAPTHRSWAWTYDEANDIVEHTTPEGMQYFLPMGGHRTRAERIYVLAGSYDDERQPCGSPCSVTQLDGDSIQFHSKGPSLAVGPTQPSDFLSFLQQWGGEWMWENVHNEGQNLAWVVDAMTNGTAIWVTDGSYHRDAAPQVSGAGWLVYCTKRKRKLYGSFFERSPKAGSYRGELLGLLAIHTLIAALEQFYSLPATTNKVCCDNQGALYKSKQRRRRIPVGASQADIKRAFRNVTNGLKATLVYEWVESHQDRYKLWWQLPIEQQLNCLCDDLAKAAVRSSISADRRRLQQQLPQESAAVFIAGMKQTSDVSKDVRYQLSLVDARRFYTSPIGDRMPNGRRRKGGLGWSAQSFDAVDWAVLDAVLDKKGQMYREWLAKQCSGFCGTQHMVSLWDSARDGKCPDCGQEERAIHLNLCPDPDRVRLQGDMADELEGWLRKNFCHRELAYCLPRYIKLRGTRRLSEFPNLSPEMRKVAASQDLIPWTSFMEGKLSKEIFLLQNRTLVNSPSRLDISAWAKKLVSQILQMSHAQWVFRNVSLHDERDGYLRDQKREQVLAEVDRLSTVDPASLPESQRYLLEIDFSSPSDSNDLVKQSYWLYAMRAAMKAGRRARGRRRRATARELRTATAVATARRRRGVVPGATATWVQTLQEQGVLPLPSRRRLRSSSISNAGRSSSNILLEGDDNKRRRPD